jgi:DNA polymerase-2
MYHDYGLEGVWELARITSLPVQTAARVSPGTGISSMQIVNALRGGILVPWRKQQAEHPKSIVELIRSDLGGLVFQPITGLHKDVAEIDFVSMYPSIMERFNISPETIIPGMMDAETGLPFTRMNTGLVPQTLKPLLEKRIALKAELASMSRWDYRYAAYKAHSSAHKWLLVTCFGYLGYKNARFGRIEAHEAVTAYGREALLRAKEAAEDLGFEVLHLYVDGMWIRKAGCREVKDFQPLLERILSATNLPIALDGIYRWVAFLPSRRDARLPVANRYFGVFQSGEIKARGIELRRHDTPRFISEIQREILDLFGSSSNVDTPLKKTYGLLHQRILDLNKYRIALEKLLVTQTLSKKLEEYQVNSALRIAVGQLQTVNKFIRPGQRVQFLYTRGKPGVHAWDLPSVPSPNCINTAEYQRLLFRAVETILTPFDIPIDKIRQRVFDSSPYSCYTQMELPALRSAV